MSEFKAWLGEDAVTVTYPGNNTINGFKAGTVLDAAEFNGAFRMMSVVATAIMNGTSNVTPDSSVADVDNAIKAKVAKIPVDRLKTARNLKVNLASTDSASFDGSADVMNIGVSDVLPTTNGGTGKTSLSEVEVGHANIANIARTSDEISINGISYSLSLSGTTLTLTAGK